MKLIVRVNDNIQAAGLCWYFQNNYVIHNLSMMETAESVIIDPESHLIDIFNYPVGALDGSNVCNADIGIEAIKDLLAKPEVVEAEVGDTIVFEYDGVRLDTKRVILVKEVDTKHIKGLDVLDSFAFKSFRRDKISNLKQVKA
jgi:hypothetical protein